MFGNGLMRVINQPTENGNLLRCIFNERRVWSHLGWRDLRSRYARTVIGPWWSAANLITVVFGSSLAVGLISDTTAFSQMPRMALGLGLWTYMSSALNESVDLFESDKSLLLNSDLSVSSFVARLIWRNLLVFAHNLAVIILFFAINSSTFSWRLLILAPISLLIGLSLFFPIYMFARLSLSIKDLKVVFPSLVQFTFFLTPVLWTPPTGGPMYFIFGINPAGWIIEFSRRFIIDNQFDERLIIKSAIFSTISFLCFLRSQKSMKIVRKLL